MVSTSFKASAQGTVCTKHPQQQRPHQPLQQVGPTVRREPHSGVSRHERRHGALQQVCPSPCALLPCSKFAQMADQKAGQVTAKVKRLGKELRNLQSGRTPLPVHAAASIFVRYDEDRNDKMRCIITGRRLGLWPKRLVWCGGVQQLRTADAGCSAVPQVETRMLLVLLCVQQ